MTTSILIRKILNRNCLFIISEIIIGREWWSAGRCSAGTESCMSWLGGNRKLTDCHTEGSLRKRDLKVHPIVSYFFQVGHTSQQKWPLGAIFNKCNIYNKNIYQVRIMVSSSFVHCTVSSSFVFGKFEKILYYLSYLDGSKVFCLNHFFL